MYGVIQGISPNLTILNISVISCDRKKYQRKRMLVWKGQMWRGAKMFSQGHIFRKISRSFLSDTAYFYYNTLIAHRKTNSTMCMTTR